MKFKISELLNDVQECVLPLEGSSAVPWEKVEELTLNKINKAQAEVPAPKRKNRRRIAILAVAALLSVCVTVTAAASGALSSVGDLFAAWFGGQPDQIELIERLGQPLGQTDSRNGITISADAILSDGNNFVVLFTAFRDNGEPFIPADAQPGGTLHFGFFGGGDVADSIRFVSKRNHFVNEAPGDIAVRFLCYYEAPNGLPSTLLCGVHRMEYWTKDSEGHMQIVELYEKTAESYTNDGVWQLEIPLPTGGQVVETTPIDNDPFSANGEEFAVTGLKVSPLAVTVEYKVTSTTPSAHASNIEWYSSDGIKLSTPSHGDDDRDFKENMTLILRKKDGTEIDLSTCVSSMGRTEPMGTVTPDWEQDKYLCRYGGVLPEVIPMEDMECIIFNGLEYPVGR